MKACTQLAKAAENYLHWRGTTNVKRQVAATVRLRNAVIRYKLEHSK